MAPEARSNDAAAILLRAIMSADGRPSRPAERPGPVIREELTRLFTWEERHRRLAARLLIAFGLTLLVLAVGSVLIWVFESGVKGGDIHGYGDAVFFTAVQLLTIPSAITNPLTTGGKVVDVALEWWMSPWRCGRFSWSPASRAASPPFSPPGTPVKRGRRIAESPALSRAPARTAADG
jgi:hypothetical protein